MDQNQKQKHEPGTLFVTSDGTAYRLRRAETNPLTDRWHEDYDVLTVSGSQSKRYDLPDDAVMVWQPPSPEES